MNPECINEGQFGRKRFDGGFLDCNVKALDNTRLIETVFSPLSVQSFIETTELIAEDYLGRIDEEIKQPQETNKNETQKQPVMSFIPSWISYFTGKWMTNFENLFLKTQI